MKDSAKGPHRFIECLVPSSHCNLRCGYCYVIQEGRRDGVQSPWRCTPEGIGHAFAPSRWGGIMLINLCGYGETMLPRDMPRIIAAILAMGHYVSVTNNGTIGKRIEETLNLLGQEERKRLCFAFSLHYNELNRLGLLKAFSNNVHMVRDAGCSFLVQLNLADEYVPILDEIKSWCLDQFGALPQVALTRREESGYEIYTDFSEEEYVRMGRSFDSPLFDYTYENFMHRRHEFCYAGDWSFKLDLATGDLRSCYFTLPYYNIYDRPDEPIPTRIVGNNCGMAYCVNSSHFMSLGVIPELCGPSYIELRDRPCGWYTPQMREFLSHRLWESHEGMSHVQKAFANTAFLALQHWEMAKRLPSRVLRRL